MNKTHMMLITGLSGSGKSLIHDCLEDLGYYCVDNLPISLIGKFFDLIGESSGVTHAAVVTDVRERAFLTDFVRTFVELKERMKVELLFLEASEPVLIQRFSETRRRHPLATSGTLTEALRLEREKLQPVRELADSVVDTSALSVPDLREYIRRRFGTEGRDSMLITVESFGFKHGLPREADLLFDVRFLPNPHYIASLRDCTGLDREVQEYVREVKESGELVAAILAFLRFVLPRYEREGRAYLTIAVGCTGGKHRSVVIAADLAAALRAQHHSINVKHRDVERAAETAPGVPSGERVGR